MFVHFKKINVYDYELSRVQDNVDDAFRRAEIEPFLSGNYITKLIDTTDTYINHGLQRKINGYIVIDKDAASDVHTSTTTNNMPDKQLILKATVPVTAKLYIF